MVDSYPRDLVGYGRNTPDPDWPDGAHIAVQFVINYEDGGENCILHGDGGGGRAAALARFLDHVSAHDEVWVARRVDIARHWHTRHGIGK